MNSELKSKLMTAEEAAMFINNGDVIGTSGFTPAGYPKATPKALAQRAIKIHDSGEDFKVSLYTGASVGDELDGELARANALYRRMPYQSHGDVRASVNSGNIEFCDLHLSHMAQMARYGFVPKVDVAIVEAVELTADGKLYLSTSGGAAATYLQMADKIIVELNSFYGTDLMGYHDVYLPLNPPNRQPIPIVKPGDRIGTEYVQIDMSKVVGIIETNEGDKTGGFRPVDDVSQKIADNILEFLSHETKIGRLPKGLPYQSGVGNVANAVLGQMAIDDSISEIALYTEVIQDSIFPILESGKLSVASGASLTLSPKGQLKFKENMNAWKSKFVLRQQELSNNPEVIRRLGTISMNTAIEFDIFGHVNSTHIMGSKMMNGIGGSGDFIRNCYLPIFMAPSVAKGGSISAIVPMASHIDHTEHDTQIFVTEQGLADVRGLAPVPRAKLIIEKCAHPDYKDLLNEYLDYGLKNAPSKHTPHVMSKALDFHKRFIETGSMKA